MKPCFAAYCNMPLALSFLQLDLFVLLAFSFLHGHSSICIHLFFVRSFLAWLMECISSPVNSTSLVSQQIRRQQIAQCSSGAELLGIKKHCQYNTHLQNCNEDCQLQPANSNNRNHNYVAIVLISSSVPLQIDFGEAFFAGLLPHLRKFLGKP